jgi:hypothetical protein
MIDIQRNVSAGMNKRGVIEMRGCRVAGIGGTGRRVEMEA